MRILMAIVAGTVSVAHAVVLADTSVEQRLRSVLGEALPGIEIASIRPAPLKGMHEVVLGGEVIYVSDDGRFILKGDLMDLKDKRNISDERRAQARITGLKAVPPNTMIEFAPPDTQHVLYVYTDVDCGYCRKFHQEVGTLNAAGIAVRYLAFPRAGVGSESFKKSESVWCATDRNAALTEAKAGKSVPAATCDNPVKTHYELGTRMGVRGTPALISEDGQELGGYVPAEQLIQYVRKDRS